MKVGSLCSGYGGLDLALGMVLDVDTVWHVEADPHASTVLTHHWPDVPNHGDLTAIDWDTVEPIEIVTAGFPCQPISTAGRRKVTNDARWLWPHIADAVRVLRPRIVVLENVAGLLTPWRDGRWWRPAPIEEVAADLVSLGYVGSWRCLRASDVGAPHRQLAVGSGRLEPVADTDGRSEPQPHLRSHQPRLKTPRRDDVGGLGGATAHPPGGSRQDEQVGGDETGQSVGAVDRAGARDRRGEIAEEVLELERTAGVLAWGPYAAAIERWERLTRPAPAPTDDRGRLNPEFSEWMMGLPAGWVTDVGISRTAQLRCIGNGVCPQQGAAALRLEQRPT